MDYGKYIVIIGIILLAIVPILILGYLGINGFNRDNFIKILKHIWTIMLFIGGLTLVTVGAIKMWFEKKKSSKRGGRMLSDGSIEYGPKDEIHLGDFLPGGYYANVPNIYSEY